MKSLNLKLIVLSSTTMLMSSNIKQPKVSFFEGVAPRQYGETVRKRGRKKK